MSPGAGDPIRSPDQDDVELAAASVSHHGIEAWPLCLGTADPVGVLFDDLEAALCGHLSKIMQLALRVLIESTDPHVERSALHARLLFLGATTACLETYFCIKSSSTTVISRP